MELHTTTVFDNTGTTTYRDLKAGLLINFPKFLVSLDGKSEDIALGLNFVKTEWLEMPLWHFIDKVVFLKQLKDLQLSAGWNTNQPVQVTKYFGVIIMSGENNLQSTWSIMHTRECGCPTMTTPTRSNGGP